MLSSTINDFSLLLNESDLHQKEISKKDTEKNHEILEKFVVFEKNSELTVNTTELEKEMDSLQKQPAKWPTQTLKNL